MGNQRFLGKSELIFFHINTHKSIFLSSLFSSSVSQPNHNNIRGKKSILGEGFALFLLAKIPTDWTNTVANCYQANPCLHCRAYPPHLHSLNQFLYGLQCRASHSAWGSVPSGLIKRKASKEEDGVNFNFRAARRVRTWSNLNRYTEMKPGDVSRDGS